MLSLKLGAVKRFACWGGALLFVHVSSLYGAEMVLAPPKGRFIPCADAESFALPTNDFSRFTQLDGEDGREFNIVMDQIGRPALRLASMQRWDWRGEKESNALVASEQFHEITKAWGFSGRAKAINYRYVTARRYYEYAKANGILTIPMLDVRFFFDSAEGKVLNTPDNLARAAKQYAVGYAKFIKSGKYPIIFWEVGNEEYLPAYKFSPAQYAAVVKAYVDAIRRVDPAAKFGIQLGTWLPEWKNWSEQVLGNLKGYEAYISYANFHYYAPWYFTDAEVANQMAFLWSFGFKNTKLAITEWRPTSTANMMDQEFKSASSFSRHFMFLLRHPDVELACVHSFPLFGGLAEWSDGSQWTSYSGKKIGRPDTIGVPRWRVLPFGMAQKMISGVTKDAALHAYHEEVGRLSYYQFNNSAGGYSLVLINEGSSMADETVHLLTNGALKSIQGNELFSIDPEAMPNDIEPQPWSVKKVRTVSIEADTRGGSIAVLEQGNAVHVRLRPFSVVTLELN